MVSPRVPQACCETNDIWTYLALYQSLNLDLKIYILSLLKLLPMLRLPRDFLFVPAANPAFDPTTVDGAGWKSVSVITFSVGLCSSLEDVDCSLFSTTSSSIYQYLLVTVFDINTCWTRHPSFLAWAYWKNQPSVSLSLLSFPFLFAWVYPLPKEN